MVITLQKIIGATKPKMLNLCYLIIISKILVKELIEVKIINTSNLNNTEYTNHGILVKLNYLIMLLHSSQSNQL